jgi:hypothetical protein
MLLRSAAVNGSSALSAHKLPRRTTGSSQRECLNRDKKDGV